MNIQLEKKSSFLLSFIFVLLCLSSYGQVNLGDKLPVDSDVKIGKLENGLTYYIRKNARPEKKVELRLVVNAGSILETDDQRGLAHFTEHMAFNGSKHFQKNDLVSFLQTIGVEFGADLNAYTSFDETVYILPIPTEKKENVQKAFQILEDWASTITFDEAEINKERGIVLEEERIGKGADERIFRVTYPKILEGSRYAVRLPIGKSEVIRTFKPETIKKFYSDWYRPELMAVIAVGDIDPAEIEGLIKKHFSALKSKGKKKVRTLTDVPPRQNSEGLVVTDKEATNHVVEIYYPYKRAKVNTTLGDYRESIV
jgi:zinc protease